MGSIVVQDVLFNLYEEYLYEELQLLKRYFLTRLISYKKESNGGGNEIIKF